MSAPGARGGGSGAGAAQVERLRTGARALAGRAALRLARRLRDGHLAELDYPPSAAPGPRWGHGRPPHGELAALLAAGRERQRAELEAILAFRDDLVRVPARAEGEARWLSEWLLGLDCASLYAYLRRRDPARYVEVGSGMSTLWARRAVRDGGLRTRIESVDPAPRAAVDAACDELVRRPLELADLGRFEALEAGDVVVMDGSHRAFTGSDATVFALEVLPRLAAGVLVGIHDVTLPDDYLPEWSGWLWSEQYLLAAWLLGGGRGVDVVLPCWRAAHDPELAAVLEPLWDGPLRAAGVDPRGLFMWLETTGR